MSVSNCYLTDLQKEAFREAKRHAGKLLLFLQASKNADLLFDSVEDMYNSTIDGEELLAPFRDKLIKFMVTTDHILEMAEGEEDE